MSIVYTEKEKCKGCYACIRGCPSKAIKVEQGQAQVIKERCIACGRAVEGDAVAWAPLGGGVVCPDCRGRYPEAELLAGTTLKVLRAIQRGPSSSDACAPRSTSSSRPR